MLYNAYNEAVEKLFFSPRHVGSLDLQAPRTLYGSYVEQLRGQQMDLYLQYNESAVITKICFKAHGEPYLIAGVEWACRQLEKQSLQSLPEISHQKLMQALAIPSLRFPFALFIEQSFAAFIEEAKSNFLETRL